MKMKWMNAIAVAAVLVGFYGCSKNSGGQPEEGTLKIMALEKATRKPIAGAIIDLLRCGRYDYQLGCMEYVVIRSFTAGAAGEVSYTSLKDIAAVEAAHPAYWKGFKEGSYGEVLLSPNSWVRLRLKQSDAYDAGSYVNVLVTRDCIGCGWFGFVANYHANVGLPADTTFLIRVEATESTEVSWSVIKPDGTGVPQVVKSESGVPFVPIKNDTLDLTISY